MGQGLCAMVLTSLGGCIEVTGLTGRVLAAGFLLVVAGQECQLHFIFTPHEPIAEENITRPTEAAARQPPCIPEGSGPPM